MQMYVKYYYVLTEDIFNCFIFSPETRISSLISFCNYNNIK